MQTNKNINGGPINRQLSAEQLNAFFLEQEQLLDRVARSATHHQILGVDRDAATEEIRLAYLRSAVLLNPSQFGIDIALPATIQQKTEKAFEAISQAYSTLVNSKERDKHIESSRSRPTPPSEPVEPDPEPDTKSFALASDVYTARPAASPASLREAEIIPVAGVAAANRRKGTRFRLVIPVRVSGCDRNGGKWHEITKTVDVSNTGILLRTTRSLRHGSVLYLTLPLPRNLRAYGHHETTYSVYAIVRRVLPTSEGNKFIGVEFIGPRPPSGYQEKPWAIFRMRRSSDDDRRRKPRQLRRLSVSIEYFLEPERLIAYETTVTENISSSGMRVLAKRAPAEFDYVRVRYTNGEFESLAAIADRFIGKDKIERLCLRLLESSS